ncbi:MAG TPA: 5-formyltetrahydrofolate cyclo-ligase [Noviherbaspirillum sp.]|uniref:5-formyltetrahydrofolate cyclo-ligase n=1 Tax=Noviherbaspirillum sp. TaxID=1926288 RepID=UPI002DDD6003|nr:5-formyltetrahydrofolate cyclo-ligase [Noviherbaspirillum sp.]HEV2609791.1 5-formyltetrahydrofolate cyclo-ligase [Noviherbaspirillum sp.]
MTNKPVDKTTLRRMLLAARQSIPMEVRRRQDESIAHRIIEWWHTCRPNKLGVYLPIRGEPELHAAYVKLHALGVQLALPMVKDKGAPLLFVAWQPGDPLSVDAMGIPGPVATAAEVQPDALLIPCVGFSEAGFRLGYGGGYYDRTLARTPRPMTVGIAYRCLKADIQPAPYDVPMDVIITE